MSEQGSSGNRPDTATVAIAMPDGERPPSSGEFLPAGTKIGPYRIDRLLGHGGMGEVYLAEQLEPVQRHVALKLLPAGPVDTRRVALFSIESQMLANMQHPAIAQVFDAGTTSDGRPYFAMEYVDGMPLTDFCEEHRLDLHQRFELFIRVCRGVQHAHQKGFIHRDLKPANILVTEIDGVAQPKIIDFGIATATRRALGAGSAAPVAGTPEYMSPEQAGVVDLDVDLRSDVFSLGAVLFELLTESRPLDSEWYRSSSVAQARRAIQPPSAWLGKNGAASLERLARERGMSPRQFRRVLTRDLDWVVLRAMHPDRDQRYDSAAVLADDIRRFLDRRPVEAAPWTRRYRLGRFVARYRVAVGVTGVVALALVAGLAAAIAGFMQASHERDRAERALDLAEAVNTFLVEDLLGSADIEVSAEGGDVTVREVLEKARRSAGERFSDRPVVEAGVRFMVATSLRGLGHHESAEEELRRAHELRLAELGSDHPETLRAAQRLAGVIQHRGRLDEAEEWFDDVYERQRRLLGERHPDTIQTLNSLGVRDWQAGVTERGIERTERALELAREELGSGHRETLIAKNNLARLYRAVGKEQQAEELGLAAVAGRTELYGPDSLLTLESRNDLAGLYRGMGRLEDAAGHYEAVLESYRRVAGPKHSGTVIAMNNLARTYAGMGRHEQAVALYREALAHGDSALDEGHWILAMFSMNLGRSLAETGEIDEAREKLTGAYEKLSARFDADDPRVESARDALEALSTGNP